MDQLIKEILRVIKQPGTRENLESSIQEAVELHKKESKNLDDSEKSPAKNIALLKERLAEQKLLSRKSEVKANNLINMDKKRNDSLFENYKKQIDEEKKSLIRKVETSEAKNKALSKNLTNLPALQDELKTIQGLLASEKIVQEKLLGDKARAEKELENAKTKLDLQSPVEENAISIKESIKQIKNYKTENLNLKKQVELLNNKDKKITTDRGALEEEVTRFQGEIKTLQEKLIAVEVEKDELNKHKEEILALQGEKDGEDQKVINELNVLDEQSKSFKIINKLNEESFEVIKTSLNSTTSFDERISKLDVFINKTKEHIETITKENNNADSSENFSTDVLDYFSSQIDKKETIKGILIKEKEITGLDVDEGEDGTTVIIQKKINKKHVAHGGSWKVAYADFVTAMMAFFLMLWLLSMLSQESRDNLKEYFKSYKAFKHTGKQDIKSSDSIKAADSDSLNDVILVEEIKKRFQGADEHLKVENVPGGIRIQVMDLTDKPMFETGSATFTQTALEIMEFIAMRISDIPGNILLEGHTDGTPYADVKYRSNWELSMDRASAARVALLSHGVLSPRFRRVIAYAGTEPLIANDYFNPNNRRISIILLTDDIADIYKKELPSENNEKSTQH
ncbi:MAG: OmpA family protein [Nitrospinaceae bacterium]|jgi:chemotaxis protein MotB|nr:OmpA family protein [Nitrospinaceae bacterium]